MMIIAGVLQADGGSVALDGRIGYCPQTPVLYDKLTVHETFRLFGVAYGMGDRAIEEREAELIGSLEFGGYHDVRVEHLSSTWRWHCSTTPRSCCWTSRTPGSTTRRIFGSGRSRRNWWRADGASS